jgi:hypothetical protein
MNTSMLQKLFRFGSRCRQDSPATPRGNITQPTGSISLMRGPATCVIVVGPSFNQDIPTAAVTCRMGYAGAFEGLGIPWVIADQQDLADMLPELTRPFCMVNGSDFQYMERNTLRALRRDPHSVWVDPWFRGSDRFFAEHGLDARIWAWPDEQRRKILDSNPAFVHTATVAGGLCFFEEWQRRGMHVISLPLACDDRLYRPDAFRDEFVDIRMAFVGGYWESKGRQIDRYLRPFEDELVIYGYSPWPYRGYRGMLPRDAEPALYRQARVCPVVNEPSVAILHGQINERIFKVLGSGGVPLVDAVPAYRELFTEEELFIPKNEDEFIDCARRLLVDEKLRESYRRGQMAVRDRHTYRHRALQVLMELDLSSSLPLAVAVSDEC